jgi:pilus assembly protein FimV
VRADADSTAAPDISLDVHTTESMEEPDITLDAPTEKAAARVARAASEPDAHMANVIDFNFESPAADTPVGGDTAHAYTHDGTVILSPQNQEKTAELTLDVDMNATAKIDTPPDVPSPPTVALGPLDLDSIASNQGSGAPMLPEFKLDDIDLSLDDAPKSEAPKADGGGAKDDHWYDVQTKFDLAKAYQEMGDKDGAKEILNEVVKEGDTSQQEEARQLLKSLG